MTSTGSWGDIIEEAEIEHFVGREQELDTLSRRSAFLGPDI